MKAKQQIVSRLALLKAERALIADECDWRVELDAQIGELEWVLIETPHGLDLLRDELASRRVLSSGAVTREDLIRGVS